MKKIISISITCFVFLTALLANTTSLNKYDAQFVQISKVKHKNEDYYVVMMSRKDNHIKAKYFAAADFDGTTVPNRFKKWSAGKNLVCVTSGTYMDNSNQPVGLTIDNGVVVNKNLTNQFDGLVIVYATGGIAISNLKDKDLTLSGGGIDASKKFDLRGSSWDVNTFVKWSESQEATVFQTHLLVYKNQLKVFPNGSKEPRERRFLAVGKDANGNTVHAIVHKPQYSSLYEGSKSVLEFLNEVEEINVTFMINLDTGMQDVFSLYNKDGSTNGLIAGKLSANSAVNLLTYYFE